MGWAHTKDKDSFTLRETLVRHLDVDILGISETHLLNDQVLSLDGFTWFGNNRKGLHRKAKKKDQEESGSLKKMIFLGPTM